jgi:hypothetical protein
MDHSEVILTSFTIALSPVSNTVLHLMSLTGLAYDTCGQTKDGHLSTLRVYLRTLYTERTKVHSNVLPVSEP